MRYRTVDKGAFRVVGRKARLPLVHAGANPAIGDFVRGVGPETVRRIAALADQEPAGIAGAGARLGPGRAEGTELAYSHGAVTGAAVPEDMDALDVPAGTWAVFEHSGPFPQALQYLWRDVFTQWFPPDPYGSRPGPETLSVRLSGDGTQADAALRIPVERSAV